jgi:MarR family 2-MHQ and catechol resistance regulon transcriptional repressor
MRPWLEDPLPAGNSALDAALPPLPEPADRQATETLARLLRAHGAVTRQLERVFARHGISEPKFNVLLNLAQAAGHRLPLYVLSDRLFVCRSNITALVDRLEEDGLVRRVPDPSNRRQVLAELTPVGYQRLLAVLPDHWDNERHIVAPLDASEQQELARLLEKLAT